MRENAGVMKRSAELGSDVKLVNECGWIRVQESPVGAKGPSKKISA
jgi:hypothetical protein